MTRKAIGTFVGLPLTPAIATEQFVFVTGQVGSRTDGSYPADIGEQTRTTLDKMAALLTAADSSMAEVVKTTVFITDLANFPAMNAVYSTYFPDEPPARSTIGCKLVDAGALVEIEAIALRKA